MRAYNIPLAWNSTLSIETQTVLVICLHIGYKGREEEEKHRQRVSGRDGERERGREGGREREREANIPNKDTNERWERDREAGGGGWGRRLSGHSICISHYYRYCFGILACTIPIGTNACMLKHCCRPRAKWKNVQRIERCETAEQTERLCWPPPPPHTHTHPTGHPHTPPHRPKPTLPNHWSTAHAGQ